MTEFKKKFQQCFYISIYLYFYISIFSYFYISIFLYFYIFIFLYFYISIFLCYLNKMEPPHPSNRDQLKPMQYFLQQVLLFTQVLYMAHATNQQTSVFRDIQLEPLDIKYKIFKNRLNS